MPGTISGSSPRGRSTCRTATSCPDPGRRSIFERLTWRRARGRSKPGTTSCSGPCAHQHWNDSLVPGRKSFHMCNGLLGSSLKSIRMWHDLTGPRQDNVPHLDRLFGARAGKHCKIRTIHWSRASSRSTLGTTSSARTGCRS